MVWTLKVNYFFSLLYKKACSISISYKWWRACVCVCVFSYITGWMSRELWNEQKLVITTKSVEFMPFFISLASFGNGIAWTIYALIRFDPFIVVGIFLSLCPLSELIVYFLLDLLVSCNHSYIPPVSISHSMEIVFGLQYNKFINQYTI